MGTQTSKLGLTKPSESDFATVNTLNRNFDIIDSLVHIKSSGTATSTVYGYESSTSSIGNVTWYYKKYDDGTFSAYTKYADTKLLCKNAWGSGSKSVYVSDSISINTPNIGISAINNCQLSIAGNVFNWPMNITNNSETMLSKMGIRAASIYNETENTAKTIYITIEGTYSR